MFRRICLEVDDFRNWKLKRETNISRVISSYMSTSRKSFCVLCVWNKPIFLRYGHLRRLLACRYKKQSTFVLYAYRQGPYAPAGILRKNIQINKHRLVQNGSFVHGWDMISWWLQLTRTSIHFVCWCFFCSYELVIWRRSTVGTVDLSCLRALKQKPKQKMVAVIYW